MEGAMLRTSRIALLLLLTAPIHAEPGLDALWDRLGDEDAGKAYAADVQLLGE